MNKLRPALAFALLAAFTVACQNRPNETASTAGDAKATPAVSTAFEAAPQSVAKTEVTTLAIGQQAPDFNLPGADGKNHRLSDFADAPALVVVFTCNHCPTAQAYEQRIKDLVTDYQRQGVAVVAISPNSPLAVLYNELGYSDLGDTYEDMQKAAADRNFNFPYLYDGDDHAVSLQYGPVATPHAFVFDQDRALRYVGRLDASEKPGTGQAEDVRAAIDAVLAGETVPTATTKTFGCSVKWAWKNEYREKMYKEWDETPVTLEEIDEAGVADLLGNDTEKLRLINVWATWCGPCVLEYPDFIEMQRMYGERAFEFVSISADKPAQRDKALAFLQKKHSVLDNYIFDKDDTYALIEAVDPDWQGALPYTVLVEPGGQRIYSQQGTIDPFELRKTIVEHELMGRYY